jgi:hypothetical protein
MSAPLNRPLPSQAVARVRAHVVRHLRAHGGTIREVAQVLRFSPEEVRRYEAKAKRFWP